MVSPPDTSNLHPADEPLPVSGALPARLVGQLVAVDPDGLAHSFVIHMGTVSYRSRSAEIPTSVSDLVAFDGSVFTCGDDASVRQLTPESGSFHRVDLAGHRRTVAACPMVDDGTGELHLVARDWGGTQLHVVVPRGALTRRRRLIDDAPARVTGLAVGVDHVVFVADGSVGVASRDGEARTHWIAVDADAPRPVHTHRMGPAIVLVVLAPSLERWIVDVDARAVEREVLDPTPRRFARSHGAIDGTLGVVWTTGGSTIARHDLVERRLTALELAPDAPGDFALVPDPAHPGTAAGWFVGFVHHSSHEADLVVIDAADLAGGAVARIRVPPPISHRLRCTWVPAAHL